MQRHSRWACMCNDYSCENSSILGQTWGFELQWTVKPGQAHVQYALGFESISWACEIIVLLQSHLYLPMTPERRQRPRPVADSVKGLSNAELDKAIRELKEKVKTLMAERDARQNGNMQSDVPPNSLEGKGE